MYHACCPASIASRMSYHPGDEAFTCQGEKILVGIKNDPFSIRAAQLPYFNLIAWKRVIKASFLLKYVYP